jgi:tetratricopeptide (TPR) repeat protein
MIFFKKLALYPKIIKARRLTHKANDALRKGDHSRAKAFYLQLEESRLVNYMIFHNIATIYFEEKDLDKAEEYFLKATQLNPKSISSFSLLSEVYMRRREWKKAEEAVSRALEAEPFNYFIQKRRDKVFNKEWRTAYVRSLELTEKGALAARNGDMEKAKKAYKEAVGANQKNALAHYLYGLLLYQEGAREQGIREVSLAVECEPENKNYGTVLNHLQKEMRQGAGE